MYRKHDRVADRVPGAAELPDAGHAVAADGPVHQRDIGNLHALLPELFPTRLRATGVGFCFNVARIFAAIGPFIAGSLVVAFGGIPKSGAAMALSYVIGLIAVCFAPETRGKPLPE